MTIIEVLIALIIYFVAVYFAVTEVPGLLKFGLKADNWFLKLYTTACILWVLLNLNIVIYSINVERHMNENLLRVVFNYTFVFVFAILPPFLVLYFVKWRVTKKLKAG